MKASNAAGGGCIMTQCCEDTQAAHSRGEPVGTKLQRIAKRARQEPNVQFSSLYHLLTEELLGEWDLSGY